MTSRSGYDETMDILARSELIRLRVSELNTEAQNCTDLARMTAIRHEIEVLHASMLEIRREQLERQIERAQPKPKRRWWRRSR